MVSDQPTHRGPAVRYEVCVHDPHKHLVQIDLSLERTGSDGAAEGIDLCFPVWVPGSYLVREFARQVISVHAWDGDGKPLSAVKMRKDTWRVEAAEAVHVRYQLNAQELSVRTPYLDGELGLFTGANLFAYIAGEQHRPIDVRWNLPEGWIAYSAKVDGFAGARFALTDFDELADTAVALLAPQLQDQALRTFTVRGVAHAFLTLGDCRLDMDKALQDITTIIDVAARIFPDALPYARYLFVLLPQESGRAGLEHLDASVIGYSRTHMHSRSDYVDLMLLLAHEHFHVWNIKRIRPDVLGPFDYQQENYTRDLWFAEGVTSYYQSRILVDAGIMTVDEFVQWWDTRLSRFNRRPGRLVEALEDASFDAWIKYYRRDGASPNLTISYYVKGSLVALLLDLEIRARTGEAKSLDDVLRHLWVTYAQRGVGYPEASLQQQIEHAVGGSYQEFFDGYIRGVKLLPLEEALSRVGIEMHVESRSHRLLIGAVMAVDGVTVRTVLRGSAAEEGGLMTGDELIAVNGYRVHADGLENLLGTFSTAQPVEVTYFRRGRLTSTMVALRAAARSTVMRRCAQPTPQQDAAFHAWLGHAARRGLDRAAEAAA